MKSSALWLLIGILTTLHETAQISGKNVVKEVKEEKKEISDGQHVIQQLEKSDGDFAQAEETSEKFKGGKIESAAVTFQKNNHQQDHEGAALPVQQRSNYNENYVTHHHGIERRQIRTYVVRCCGRMSCLGGSGRSSGGGGSINNNINKWGVGQRPSNNPGNSNWVPPSRGRGGNRTAPVVPVRIPFQFRNAVATASFVGEGVSIACTGCALGWQQYLNMGHGVGFIPVTCPGCPKGWQTTIGMGPGVPGGSAVNETDETEEGDGGEGEEGDDAESADAAANSTTVAP